MAYLNIEARVDSDFSELHAVISKMDTAAWGALEDLREIGIEAAKEAMPGHSYASSGDHHGPGRPPIHESLHSEHFGRTINIWIEDVNALSQEFGAAPHEIHGNPMLKFYWEKEEVLFRGPMVNHPGNDPQPFMGAGFAAMDAAAEAILDAAYF